MVLLATSILHILAGAVLARDAAGPVSGDPAPAEPDGAALVKNYSPLGIACVVALLGSGLIEYLFLIGRLDALVSTPYGATALVKIICFTVLLASCRPEPELADAAPAGNAGHLLRSIGVEIGRAGRADRRRAYPATCPARHGGYADANGVGSRKEGFFL